MRSRLALLGALALFTGGVNAQEDPTPDQGLKWTDLTKLDSRFKLYGFIRLDSMYDNSRMNDPQTPVYARSEESNPPAGVPSGTTADPNDNEYSMSARLTRLGLEFDGPVVSGLGDPKLDGKIEVDFYNSGLDDSDSRNALRMRLAYLTLDWGNWQLLAGQDWDVISPLYPVVNNDVVMWGSGNTGDRRPQLTLTNKLDAGPGQLVTRGGIALSGAVSNTNVTGGLRAGENSGRPMFDGRVGYQGKTESGGAYQLGIWGHNSDFEYDATGGGEESYGSYSVGMDTIVPLHTDKFWAKSEYWYGKNLSDIRGGILQGVSPTGTEIKAQGGFLELGYQATEHMTLYTGYSYDNPDNSDLDAYMRSKNTVPYAAVRWRFGSLRFGFEVLHWKTEYIGLDDGTAWRYLGFIAYYF